jgi:NAD(P)-dependent dehydrogenase (short-subunit alcohol dehydrogenase family)
MVGVDSVMRKHRQTYREPIQRTRSARRYGRWYAAYRVSKTALNALTRMLADATRTSGILVNSCPAGAYGYGGAGAARSVKKGAETAVWLYFVRHSSRDRPTGGFFRDMKRIPAALGPHLRLRR